MRKCPKCGAELPDEALFCNECGEKLPSPDAETKNEQKETSSDDKTTAEASVKEPETSAKATESSAASETSAKAAEPSTADASAAGAASPAAPESAGSYTAPIDNSVLAKAQADSKNSNIGIIAVGGVILVALILVIALLLNSGGYETPIKKLVNNFNKGTADVETYLSYVAPGFVVDLYHDVYSIMKSADKDAVADFDEAVADGFEDFFDDCADDYGDDYKMTYEIRDAERLDDRDIKDIEDIYEDLFDLIDDNIDYDDEDIYEELADNLEDYYDISLSKSQIRKLQSVIGSFMDELEDFKIQDAYEVKIRLELKGEDDSEKTTITVYVIKVDGDWFIEPNSLMTAMGEGSLASNLYWYLY